MLVLRRIRGVGAVPLLGGDEHVARAELRPRKARSGGKSSRRPGSASPWEPGRGDEEGRAILPLGPCFCLTAGVPGGNLGGFWIRR